VIEGSGQPARSGMTGGTIGAITTSMLVVGGMTSITGGRCTSIKTIDVTAGTGNTDMFPGELKSR